MKDRYSVTTYSVQSILGFIDSHEIAIPEMQRPFVWDGVKVRDLIDSLYKGYPTGYLITWKNPDVKVKGGGTAQGKTVLIDGQQRVTALSAALAGKAVLNDDYETRRIKIAFNPLYDGEDSPFAVWTAPISKDKRWIPDIAEIFAPSFDSYSFVTEYVEANKGAIPAAVNASINELRAISTRQMGVIQVDADCSIDEVTDIFIRINSKGVVLSQADFAMSKIASDETYGGSMMRKAIDYWCHLAVKPEFWSTITGHDAEFMASEYASKSEWLKNDREDIYDPDYGDLLRVSFMHMFGRGKLADLVALLSGRDFEERDYKSDIANDSYEKLHEGVLKFMSKDNFKDFTLALRSVGFTSKTLMASNNAIDFAYNLYLTLRQDSSIPATEVKRYVQRWYVMSVLTGRYSAAPESRMDRDIRQISQRGFLGVWADIKASQLADTFWTVGVPQQLVTTSTRNGAWLVYVASQIKDANNTLFSNKVKVSDVVSTMGDIHHIFPKAYLKKELQATNTLCNQVANYTYLEKRINIAVGEKRPGNYFSEARAACASGASYFGDLTTVQELTQNMAANCIPEDIFDMGAEDYDGFLTERRVLMAKRIRVYFESL